MRKVWMVLAISMAVACGCSYTINNTAGSDDALTRSEFSSVLSSRLGQLVKEINEANSIQDNRLAEIEGVVGPAILEARRRREAAQNAQAQAAQAGPKVDKAEAVKEEPKLKNEAKDNKKK